MIANNLFTSTDCDDPSLIRWKLETSGSTTVPNASGATVFSFQTAGGMLTESAVSTETSSGVHSSVTTITTTTSKYDILKGVQIVSLRQRGQSTGTVACSTFTTMDTGDGTFTYQLQVVKINSDGP